MLRSFSHRNVAICILAASASIAWGAAPITPTITWATPAAIGYGGLLSANQLDAKANVPGAFSYSPAYGTALPAGSHILSVTFTPNDTVDYATATASVSITVNPAAPPIFWRTPAAIPYGTALSARQLNATANLPGTFTYSPAVGVLLDAGSQQLTATFHPTNSTDYKTVTAQIALNVTQAVPKLVWPTPLALPMGAALGPTQLNAVASAPGSTTPLPGTYLYSPGAGTVLTSASPETLNVTFTPTDEVDYAPVKAKVTLDVTIAGVVAWGDSLTEGMEGITDLGNYPTDLAELITLPIVNQGVFGQTSTQIGMREGGVPVYVTVKDGVIPASGAVAITFPPGSAPPGVPGTILGVHGAIASLSGGYGFVRTAGGEAVSAPGSPKFVVDTPYANYLPIFWEGRNNFKLNVVPAILPDLAAQVATVPPGKMYFVASITNNNVETDWKGNAEYNQIVAINTELQKTYGAHYLTLRHTLVENYDPTSAVDVSDFEHDEPPTSLRAMAGTGTLVSAIGPETTVFEVNMTTGAPTDLFIMTIDTGANAENVSIIAASGTKVAVIRNFGGHSTSHAAGVPIVITDKTHLNAKGYQIVANQIATALRQYARPPQ